MPQMSPMNWPMIISILLVTMMTMYTNMGPTVLMEHKSKKMKKKQKFMKW